MNKHPGPWTYDDDWGAIRDANGERIVTAEPIGESNSSVLFDDDKVKRLVLAAPELLEALEALTDDCPNTKDVAEYRSEWKATAMEIIARIKGAT